MSYGSSDERRHDAFVIDHAGDLGSDDASIARGILLPLNGEPEVVDLGEVETVDQHVEVPYVEIFDDRTMDSHALSADGVLYALSVGVREGSGRDVVAMARSDLGAEPMGEATRQARLRCAAQPHDAAARRATCPGRS